MDSRRSLEPKIGGEEYDGRKYRTHATIKRSLKALDSVDIILQFSDYFLKRCPSQTIVLPTQKTLRNTQEVPHRSRSAFHGILSMTSASMNEPYESADVISHRQG
jgi:hypothetical protein